MYCVWETKMHSKKLNSIRGFTIVELSVVIAFASLVFYYGLMGFRLYMRYITVEKTQERIELLVTGIEKIYGRIGRYPCPARYDLPFTDINSGEEECLAIPAVNTCANGLCYATGARDANGDGDLTNDNVIIGAFPYKMYYSSIGEGTDFQLQENITIASVLDGWKHNLTYAVTEQLTVAATFDEAFGAIAVETEVPGDTVIDPAGGAHFVIVSHGFDGKGSYTNSGGQVAACAGAGFDLENCDGDALFINGLTSLQQGANYYDDYILFRIWQATDLWEANGNDIFNTNPLNVGVNTDNPTEKLHVNGDLAVIATYSDELCDSGGADCFEARLLGGSGMRCNPGELMTGIENNNVICAPVVNSGSLLSTSCPPGQFIRGVTNLGNLVCGAP